MPEPTARRCSSAPRSTARPAASRPTTRPTRSRTSTRRRRAARGEIEHRFRAVDRDSRLRALVDELNDAELALVFVRTKRGADRLVKRLERQGVRAVAMHGNKSQNQRERALAAFESGRVNTLVATDVAARGIDVDGVSHVINFDAPDDRESYVHRIGRTGRAGRTGIGITFVEAEQARDVGRIAAALRLHGEFESAGFATATAPARHGRPAAAATAAVARSRAHAASAPRRSQRRSDSRRRAGAACATRRRSRTRSRRSA